MSGKQTGRLIGRILATEKSPTTMDKFCDKYGDMTARWRKAYAALSAKQKRQANPIIENNIFTDEAVANVDFAVRDVLQYYRIKRYEEIPEVLADD